MLPDRYVAQLHHSADLAHIGYVVKNMDRAVRQWSLLGSMVIPPTLDPVQNVLCALFLVKNSIAVELVAPVADDNVGPLESRLKRGGGLDHICFFVDDIAAAFQAEIKDRAIPLVAPTYGCVFDRQIAFVQNRAGLTIELMERQRVGRLPHDPLAGAS